MSCAPSAGGKSAGVRAGKQRTVPARRAVACGVDQDDARIGAEKIQQLKTARAAVEHLHVRRPGFLFQRMHRMHAHPLVADKIVADAEDQNRRRRGRRAW